MTRTFAAVAILAVPALAAAQVATVLTPAEAESAFRAANDACLKDDFKTCQEGFERLIGAGYGGPGVEYNLGTAYLKQGTLGWAVFHLERALRLDPSDADARANLRRAQRLRIDRIVGAAEETGGEEPLSTRVVSHTSMERWTLAFLVLWVGGGVVLALRRLAVSPSRRAAALLAGALCVTASIPCAVVTAFHVYVRESAHDAVVVAPSLPVREGPQDASKAPFEVHEGLKVRVLDQIGGFRRIRLANGLQGWVNATGIAEISPAG